MMLRACTRALALARRVGVALLWCAPVGIAAVLAHLLGIRLLGSVDGWQRWLQSHAGFFVAWRCGLYVLTGYGWWWMHRRVRQREPGIETRHRLLRIEIAAVAAVVLLEGSAWLRHG
jgi:hypothetical protein